MNDVLASVDRQDLERQLDHVRAAAAGPVAGVFGPGTDTNDIIEFVKSRAPQRA